MSLPCFLLVPCALADLQSRGVWGCRLQSSGEGSFAEQRGGFVCRAAGRVRLQSSGEGSFAEQRGGFVCRAAALLIPNDLGRLRGLLVGCLTSQQHASVSQGRICSDNFTCCHTEIEVADPTFYLTQSQYTDTGPTSPSADPITPGAWQGSHWSANV